MWIKIANIFISVVMIISSILRVDLGYGMKPKWKTVDLEGYKLVCCCINCCFIINHL